MSRTWPSWKPTSSNSYLQHVQFFEYLDFWICGAPGPKKKLSIRLGIKLCAIYCLSQTLLPILQVPYSWLTVGLQLADSWLTVGLQVFPRFCAHRWRRRTVGEGIYNSSLISIIEREAPRVWGSLPWVLGTWRQNRGKTCRPTVGQLVGHQ